MVTISFCSNQLVYTICPLPVVGGKTVSCRILLDLYNLHCFLSLLVFSAVHQLDFHMNKCVWLPKGSCLLTSKGKKKR